MSDDKVLQQQGYLEKFSTSRLGLKKYLGNRSRERKASSKVGRTICNLRRSQTWLLHFDEREWRMNQEYLEHKSFYVDINYKKVTITRECN